LEGLEQGGEVEVNNRLVQHRSVVIDLQDFHSVREWFQAQLLKQGGFGVADGLADLQELDLLQDFDHTLVDLGGDRESVEEGNLGWVHSGGTGGDVHFHWRHDAHLGHGFSAVRGDDVFEVENREVGENHTEFAHQVILENVQLWHRGSESKIRKYSKIRAEINDPANFRAIIFLY